MQSSFFYFFIFFTFKIIYTIVYKSSKFISMTVIGICTIAVLPKVICCQT